ncbi:hypothetical protein L2K20_06520 [Mycobacterium sp. MBM]|nr:hypothetical protein [Mycobacterium sp. MBM]
MNINREELRALVREVVRDAVAGLSAARSTPSAPADPPPPATVAAQLGVTPTGPAAADAKSCTDTVRLATDAELDRFVRKLLRLFENPKSRADLKAGRLRFRLAGQSTTGGGAAHRIDSGVVTERQIAEIGTNTLVLGRRAVLTPLAREKARAMGITIQKERT